MRSKQMKLYILNLINGWWFGYIGLSHFNIADITHNYYVHRWPAVWSCIDCGWRFSYVCRLIFHSFQSSRDCIQNMLSLNNFRGWILSWWINFFWLIVYNKYHTISCLCSFCRFRFCDVLGKYLDWSKCGSISFFNHSWISQIEYWMGPIGFMLCFCNNRWKFWKIWKIYKTHRNFLDWILNICEW